MAKSTKMGRMPKEPVVGPARKPPVVVPDKAMKQFRRSGGGVRGVASPPLSSMPSPGYKVDEMPNGPGPVPPSMMPPKFDPGSMPPPQMMPPAFGGGSFPGGWGPGVGIADPPMPMPGMMPPIQAGDGNLADIYRKMREGGGMGPNPYKPGEMQPMPIWSMPPMGGGNLSDYISKKGGMPGMGPGPVPMPPGMMPPVREPGSPGAPGGIPGMPGGPPLSLDIPPEVKAEWDRYDQENQKRLDGLYNQPPPPGTDPDEWKRFMDDMKKAEQENSGKYAGLPQSNGDIMQLLASPGGGALPMPAPAGIRSMTGNEPMQGVPQMTGRERNRMSRIQPQRGPRERA